MNIKTLINEFEKFSSSIRGKTDPVSQYDLEEYINSHSFVFPNEYIQLLSYSNGISLMGDEIYGIGSTCLDRSIEEVYMIEHTLVSNPMPPSIIPFSPDGFGNHYCFNSKDDSILFWQHDLPCEVNLKNFVYPSLFCMIKEVFFDWTLANWDYDGRKR